MWNLGGIFSNMVLDILSGPGVFPLVKFLRHMSYVSWSRYVCGGINVSPIFSRAYPFKSCHGYCLTPHIHCCG